MTNHSQYSFQSFLITSLHLNSDVRNSTIWIFSSSRRLIGFDDFEQCFRCISNAWTRKIWTSSMNSIGIDLIPFLKMNSTWKDGSNNFLHLLLMEILPLCLALCHRRPVFDLKETTTFSQISILTFANTMRYVSGYQRLPGTTFSPGFINYFRLLQEMSFFLRVTIFWLEVLFLEPSHHHVF